MNITKLTIISVLFCLSSVYAVAAETVKVQVESEGQLLAKGYAQAFDQMPSGAKYLVIKTAKGPQYLAGSVRSLEAVEAVLLIQMDNGPTHAISAHDVVKVTNQKD